VIFHIISFESRAVAEQTMRCSCKLRYVPKFTVASHSAPCDSTAFLSDILAVFYWHDNVVCLSIHLYLTLHWGEIIHPTAKVSEGIQIATRNLIS